MLRIQTDAKDNTSYDSFIKVKEFPSEKTSLQKQKADQWLLGARGGNEE